MTYGHATRTHHRISFLLFPIPCLPQAYVGISTKNAIGFLIVMRYIQFYYPYSLLPTP
ncbi:hypothetical protein [Moorena sp. SIO3A2]|uniref:hypothetical protein n=1 Tax=Moorena sp. SIO3A2 TaxID=2607841 RepID=UPI0013BB92F7|nr:hypothetical protein [Moorena sp. SIO3A2]NER91239.1 hypothetical protein [Moorena sp. SIO3A2]